MYICMYLSIHVNNFLPVSRLRDVFTVCIYTYVYIYIYIYVSIHVKDFHLVSRLRGVFIVCIDTYVCIYVCIHVKDVFISIYVRMYLYM